MPARKSGDRNLIALAGAQAATQSGRPVLPHRADLSARVRVSPMPSAGASAQGAMPIETVRPRARIGYSQIGDRLAQTPRRLPRLTLKWTMTQTGSP